LHAIGPFKKEDTFAEELSYLVKKDWIQLDLHRKRKMAVFDCSKTQHYNKNKHDSIDFELIYIVYKKDAHEI